MAYTLRDKIFEFFGVDAKRSDSYKDVNNKGIYERYNESLGWGYDDILQDEVDNDIDYIVVPKTVKAQLIPIMEACLGGLVNVSDAELIRRKIMKYAMPLYRARSTQMGYIFPLRLLGFDTIEFVDLSSASSFDTGTFDDPDKTFDQDLGCGCGEYKLVLTGPVTINQVILDAVQRIIIFNQPIDYKLTEVEYHGTEGSASLREDGGYILREDGGKTLLE